MTRYPRQVDREYLSCRSGGLNKIQMVDGGTPDLDQDLVACNRRRRYIVEHQLSTVFQQSDSFHTSSPQPCPMESLPNGRLGIQNMPVAFTQGNLIGFCRFSAHLVARGGVPSLGAS